MNLSGLELTLEQLEDRVLPLLVRRDGGLEQVAVLVDRLDMFTWGHSERVAQYTLAFGRSMQLEGDVLDRLRVASLLHDLGMVLCPSRIRRKPAPLDLEEFDAVHRHPADAANIVGQITRYVDVAQVIRHHHERWDGKGYPDGIAGEGIPYEARILALVDAYDAMICQRPHRPARTVGEALDEIEANAGKQFDPHIAGSFQSFIRDRFQERAERLGASTFFAELSVRSYERVVRDSMEANRDAPPQVHADQLMMQYPELSAEQCRKVVVAMMYPGKLRDDLYSDDREHIKADEVRVRHPARIDTEVGSVVRFAGRLFIVVSIRRNDEGLFEYLLKR